jgi:hypothetical protein
MIPKLLKYNYFIKLLILFIVFPGSIFSQDHELHNKIDWLPKKINPDRHPHDTNKYLLNFSGAAYIDHQSLLPYYTGVIQLTGPNAQVNLTNIKFIPFTKKELENVGHLDIVNKKVDFSYKVFKQRKKPMAQMSFLPIRRNPTTDRLEKAVSFTIEINYPYSLKSSSIKKSARNYITNSVLSSGEWYKMKVEKNGVYKLTFSQLNEMGIKDPGQVRIYGNGGKLLPLMNNEPVDVNLKQIPVWFEDINSDGFGQGDFILFYAEEATKWKYNTYNGMFLHTKHLYSDASYYFISSELGRGKEITDAPIETQPANYQISTFDDYAYHEQEDESLINSGRGFYQKLFNNIPIEIDFKFPNLLQNSFVKIRTQVLAKSNIPSKFTINIDSTNVQTIYVNGISSGGWVYASKSEISSNFYATRDDINLDVLFTNSDQSAIGWLDYITINARRKLKLSESQLLFRDIQSVGYGNIGAFEITNANEDIIVWDVTDINQTKRINASLSADTLRFKTRTDSLRQFVAFDKNASLLTPVYKNDPMVGLIENQNLHALEQPEMVIITHRTFKNQAEELAQFHRDQDGLKVIVAEQQKVFNEFSSGSPDIGAIRNFVKMFYDRAKNENQLPDYLLLFGDGSFKNRTYDEHNWILTYQTRESINMVNSYVSDDYYGLLDDDEGGNTGLLDIGIGRLPVETVQQAELMVHKIMHYNSPQSMGNWKNNLLFVTDDQDGGEDLDYQLHMSQSNSISTYIEDTYPAFQVKRIYPDAFRQINTASGERYPDAESAIIDNINKGALIFNYTGHGGVDALTKEKIFEVGDVYKLNNFDRLSLFLTASCEVTRFDEHELVSLGEYILLNDKGGAIALFSTTRLVYASQNFQLNQSFFKYAFESGNDNKRYRLGDINRLTKVNLGINDNKRKFALLGDPALKLAYPDKNVVTTNINGIPVASFKDTLKSLEEVTISGEVRDIYGNRLTDFNGFVFPFVFDKETEIHTLANDEGSNPYVYNTRNNILFQGKAKVKNGHFSFQFRVPKDISYSYGNGKISYYAFDNNYENDYRGSFYDFIIGGSGKNVINDNTGPEISLYLNDTNFINGSITSENPVLLINVFDSSGINTVNQSMGHGITAILDGNSDDKIDISPYFEPQANNYMSGSASYPLLALSEGEHTITVKAWDVLNNSSQQSISFVVTNSSRLNLGKVFSEPNPVTYTTDFYCKHNQAGNEMEVLIDIFTVSGKIIRTIKQTETPNGYILGPIHWDGLDNFGNKIERGVYLYRIIVRSNDKTAERFKKLIILK